MWLLKFYKEIIICAGGVHTSGGGQTNANNDSKMKCQKKQQKRKNANSDVIKYNVKHPKNRRKWEMQNKKKYTKKTSTILSKKIEEISNTSKSPKRRKNEIKIKNAKKVFVF